MIDETLTVPCEGIGVWEGARVRAQTLRYGEASCTVVRRTIGMAAGWWDVILDGLHVVSVHADDMRLDLTHQPTRLMVVARLAERVLTDGGRKEAAHGVTWRGNGYRQWLLQPWCCHGVVFGARMGWDDYGCSAHATVPALADIDPTDDTCLPDGARVVDVRALARVLRHVFSTKVESQCRT